MAYTLAWDSYRSNLSSGFSTLQQNGEFVDMTLAADGHLVKCHQVLVALASPYLKDMITSAPCSHPVIYLNNISHKVLSSILEYVYTGEATVPTDCLAEFAEAASSLRIKGLENIGESKDYMQSATKSTASIQRVQTNDTVTMQPQAKRKTTSEHLTSYDQQVSLPSAARKIFIKAEGPISLDQIQTAEETHHFDDQMGMDDSLAHESEDDGLQNLSNNTLNIEKLKLTSSNLLFTVSIRGSLQIILNRYIYNLNSSTPRTGMRRWRCVDYRNSRCSAFIVTRGNVVINRANVHSHPFHDKKILAKLEKKAVFSAIDEVEAFKDREKALGQQVEITVDEDILNTFKTDG